MTAPSPQDATAPARPAPDRADAARSIRIGARRSPLAVAQAEWVADLLRAAGHHVEFVGITSQGDVDKRKLTEIGGTGVFAAAVREALLDATIDVAVHSLKDLPVAPMPGLELVAIPVREDARDVLVGLPPEQWSDDTVVGTGSPRRELQLRALAAELGVHPRFVAVRGNVDTRVNLVRSGSVDATVLAAAGLRRLGRLAADGRRVTTAGDAHSVVQEDVPATLLDLDQLVPAAGQGALGIECRPDVWCHDLLAALDDPASRAAVTAERQFLATLEAGCLAPVGAHAVVRDAGLTLTAVTAATPPGREMSAAAQAGAPEGVAAAPVVRVLRAEARSDVDPVLPSSTDDARRLGDGLAHEVLRRLEASEAGMSRLGTPASGTAGSDSAVPGMRGSGAAASDAPSAGDVPLGAPGEDDQPDQRPTTQSNPEGGVVP